MRRATEFALSRRRRGQSMIEYLIILPMLLLLVLGAIQFALLYQIKSTLNYATFIAARQGALKQANKNAIKDGLASGMTPLFTFEPDAGSLLKGRVIAMVEVFNPLTTTVELLSPTKKALTDFGIANPDKTTAETVIPNDNLMYRPTTAGGQSKISVQDANLLKIRVTYCAKLIVPLANVTFYSLVNGITGTRNLTGEYFSTNPGKATTTNNCSQLKDKYDEKVGTLSAAIAKFPGPIDPDDVLPDLSGMVTSISNTLAGAKVPLLDWGIGGYRIPITAEAVVRMQSPAKL